jgi:hypothetical protein
MSSTSAIMEFTFVLFLFLSTFAQQFATEQTTSPEYCIDEMANADFYQCIYSNTATCADCKDEDIYINNINFTTCADLTDHVCSFFNCCFACETKTEKFFECSICPDYTNSIATLQPCAFDCSAFPYGNNQNGAAEPCEVEWESWIVCTSKDYKSCLDCLDYDNQVFSTVDNCAEEQQEFCYYFDCCPSCQSEYTAAYQCAIETGNSTSSLSCNGVDIYTPSGGFKNGKGAKSGIEIKNGAANYVTLLLFLLSILFQKYICIYSHYVKNQEQPTEHIWFINGGKVKTN